MLCHFKERRKKFRIYRCHPVYKETRRKDMYQLFLWTATVSCILSERLTFSGAPCRRGVGAGSCCYYPREYCSARHRRRQTPGPTHRSSPGGSRLVTVSVADPWKFGTDPDPRIHTADKWIQIRILLFSSVTFKTSTKSFFAYYFLKVHLHNF